MSSTRRREGTVGDPEGVKEKESLGKNSGDSARPSLYNRGSREKKKEEEMRKDEEEEAPSTVNVVP